MANLLTGLRLLLIIPVSWGLALPGAINAWLVLLMILTAIVTDYFDGKVARARGTASAGGMLFDHTTDFLFVTAGLAAIAYQGSIPALLPILIVIAFSQYVLDSYFLFHQKHLRMSFLGRWNGILYFAPLVAMSVAALELIPVLSTLVPPITTWFAYILVISTIASIIDRGIAPLRHRGITPGAQPEIDSTK